MFGFKRLIIVDTFILDKGQHCKPKETDLIIRDVIEKGNSSLQQSLRILLEYILVNYFP